MLKNLVKKFKSQSLNEDEPSADEQNGAGTGSAVSVTFQSPSPQTRAHTHCASAATATSTDCLGKPFRATRKMVAIEKSLRSVSGPVVSQTVPSMDRRLSATVHVKVISGTGKMCPAGTAEDKDSGTESDEELAKTETNSIHSVPVSQTSDYYASQQSLSASCRSSHCGSPLLGGFSDQECNSLDSVGCESGIGLRTNEFNDLEMPTPLELPNHHYHTRQQFHRFLQQQTQISNKNGHLSSSTNPHTPHTIQQYPIGLGKSNDAARAAIAHTGIFNESECPTPMVPNCGATGYSLRALNFPPSFVAATAFENIKINKSVSIPNNVSSPGAASSSSVDELEEIYGDYSKPKIESESALKGANDVSDHSDKTRGRSSFLACTVASEKRKWSQVRSSSSSNLLSGCAYINQVDKIIGGVNNRESNAIADRQLLTAARKTPIKLLIPPRDVVTDQDKQAVWNEPIAGNIGGADETLRLSPRKKCRPSIDEGLETTEYSGRRTRPSLNFDKMREKMVKPCRRKQHHSVNTAMKAKLRGWTPGYQLRSSRSDCLFKPLDPQAIFSLPQTNSECTLSGNVDLK